jgi:hypothetical protein
MEITIRGGFKKEKRMVLVFFNYHLVLDTRVNFLMIRLYWENVYQPITYRSMKEVLIKMYLKVMEHLKLSMNLNIEGFFIIMKWRVKATFIIQMEANLLVNLIRVKNMVMVYGSHAIKTDIRDIGTREKDMEKGYIPIQMEIYKRSIFIMADNYLNDLFR